MRDIKIGDSVWFFDVNRRVYKQDQNGCSVGGPIWREHWRKELVIGETSRSWLVGHKYDLTKLPKKGDWPRDWVASEAEVNDREWVEHHRYRISRAIDSIRDASTLRKIAELIGYEEGK